MLEQEAPARNAALTLEEERDNNVDIPLPKARAGKEIVAAEEPNCNITELNLKQFQKYNHVKVESVESNDEQLRLLSHESKQSQIDEAKNIMS